LRNNCLIRHVIKGKTERKKEIKNEEEEEEDISSYRIILRKREAIETCKRKQ